MGSGLYRSILSLKGLYPVEQSVSLKNETNSWENEWKEAWNRTLNLDPGYLDLHKVVLLSGKEGPQKIYLGGGIWSDLNLIRKAGRFEVLPWTFPDLRESRYHSFFERVRENLKLYLKSIRKDWSSKRTSEIDSIMYIQFFDSLFFCGSIHSFESGLLLWFWKKNLFWWWSLAPLQVVKAVLQYGWQNSWMENWFAVIPCRCIAVWILALRSLQKPNGTGFLTIFLIW
mgnify:CR=1 FL=1